MLRQIAVLALIAGLAVLAWRSLTGAPTAADIPIARLRAEAARGTVPYLRAPLPAWLPLPESGRVDRAAATVPQPPYGASITLMLRIDEGADAFATSYAARLAAAGYAVRRRPPPFDMSFTGELALDAFHAGTGRYVVCVLRRSGAVRSAQITFWEPPAPRL